MYAKASTSGGNLCLHRQPRLPKRHPEPTLGVEP